MAVLLLLLALTIALTWLAQRNDHCPAHVPGVGCHHTCDRPPGAHRHHCPRCGGHWATIRFGGEEAAS